MTTNRRKPSGRKLSMPTQAEILLACGEMTASELRTVKAALAWFIRAHADKLKEKGR